MSNIKTVRAREGGLGAIPAGDVLFVRGRRNELPPGVMSGMMANHRTVVFQDADTLDLTVLKSNLGLKVNSVDVT